MITMAAPKPLPVQPTPPGEMATYGNRALAKYEASVKVKHDDGAVTTNKASFDLYVAPPKDFRARKPGEAGYGSSVRDWDTAFTKVDATAKADAIIAAAELSRSSNTVQGVFQAASGAFFAAPISARGNDVPSVFGNLRYQDRLMPMALDIIGEQLAPYYSDLAVDVRRTDDAAAKALLAVVSGTQVVDLDA